MSSSDFDELQLFASRKVSLGPSSGVTSIAELYDVHINEPLQDGQILKYIEATGKWTNVDPQLLTGSTVEGYVTRSGTGYTTTFVIAHGFGSAPTHVTVDPQSPEANDDYTIMWDSVNITLEYTFPPPEGTDNLLFYYRVS